MRRVFTGMLIFLVFLLTSEARSQGIGLKGQIGYGLGTNRNLMGADYTNNEFGQTTAVKDHYHSFGQGLKAQGSIVFPVSSFISLQFESGLSLLGGFKNKSEWPTYTDETKYTSFHIPVLVSLVSAADVENLRPYLGAGAGIYWFILKEESSTTRNESIMETTYRFKLPIGFHGMIGVELNPASAICLYAEARLTSLSMFLKESELTKATNANGDDVLDQYSEDQKIIKYKKDSLDDLPPFPMPGSSIAIFFGMRLNLR